MSHDKYGRRLNARSGSPPSSFSNTSGEDMIQQRSRTGNFPPESTSRSHPRPMRSRTGPQLSTAGTGPRLPRNRFGSLQLASDGTKTPLRTNSVVTLGKPVSPPGTTTMATTNTGGERRVPPVNVTVDVARSRRTNESPLTTTRPHVGKNISMSGFVSRCIESDSEDEVQTDSVHETIKPSREMTSYMTPTVYQSKDFTRFNKSVYEIQQPGRSTFIKQDSSSSIDQQMDITVQSPTSPPPPIDNIEGPAFDPKTYQKHLENMQRSAMEWSRLQEGLAMLLPNSDGDTGFHNAVIHTKPNILSKLIELVEKYPQLSSCINDQNSLYQTSLHLATHLQQVEMMKALIKAGAMLHLQDHKGNTPLHIACQQRNTACLDVILSLTNHRTLFELADIRNYEGNSCVHVATYYDNMEGLLKLHGAGVNIDSKTCGSNKTPLHIAIEKGSFPLTQILIQSCGADFNRPMYSGCTPLHIAAGWGNIEIVAYLISLGADPYALTDEGDMPIDLVTNEGVRHFLLSVVGV